MLENTKEKMSRQLNKSYVLRQEKKWHKSVVEKHYQMLKGQCVIYQVFSAI